MEYLPSFGDSRKKRRRSYVPVLVKTLITAAVLGVILANVDTTAAIRVLGQAKIWVLVGCLGFAIPQILADGLRWQSVLKALGHGIGLRAAAGYSLVSWFFGQLAPGSLGIDAYRAAQMRQAGAPLGTAVQAVMVDRLAAYVALILVIVAGAPHALSLVDGAGDQAVVLGTIGAFVAALIVFFALGHGRLHDLLARLLPPLAAVSRLSAALRDVHLKGRVSLKIVAAGASVHILRVAVVFTLAHGLGISVALLDVFSLVPLALLVAMIPISLASWGVREAAFIYLFGFAGVSPESALLLSVSLGLYRLAVAAAGAVTWLITRSDFYAVAQAGTKGDEGLAAKE